MNCPYRYHGILATIIPVCGMLVRSRNPCGCPRSSRAGVIQPFPAFQSECFRNKGKAFSTRRPFSLQVFDLTRRIDILFFITEAALSDG